MNYYLNLDGTPFVKGDRTLDRLQSFGYIIGDGNEDGRYNIYGAHGKILLSNIETEKSADGIGINRNGDKLAVLDMNGVRIFDLITQEQVFERMTTDSALLRKILFLTRTAMLIKRSA